MMVEQANAKATGVDSNFLKEWPRRSRGDHEIADSGALCCIEQGGRIANGARHTVLHAEPGLFTLRI